ncbi:MAG: universal stress protein [Bacteroidales bacterium]|nr:universal stress protein [Bacteroidales bacterium]HPD95804.1 universal stress protein [Tenuifilaceae bacterium]HRX30984.1 universal stress protein [Tenuifilaceae bacterium]
MDDKLIDIATDSYSKAVVLKSFLESNGIECFLKNVNIIQGAVSEGVKVQISEADVPRALQLLTEMNKKEDTQKFEQHLRKILVPIDFSVPSENAARFAVMLAAKYNAEVKLLHVFNSPVVDMIPFSDMSSIQVDFDINYHVLYKTAKQRLIKFTNNIKEFANHMGLANLSIGYTLREGYAAYGIIEVSQRYKPGIIVMGTKGEGFKNTELVGSVASDVSKETHLPLLVIPEKAVLKGVDEVKKVLYATNFDDSDYRSIRKLIRILAPFNIELYCVSVSEKKPTDTANALMENLKSYLGNVNPKLKVSCSFLEGKDVVQTFLDFVKTNQINLVALTSIKRSLIYKLLNPVLSTQMLYKSEVPLLLFRD